jgi:hypothetical protein
MSVFSSFFPSFSGEDEEGYDVYAPMDVCLDEFRLPARFWRGADAALSLSSVGKAIEAEMRSP